MSSLKHSVLFKNSTVKVLYPAILKKRIVFYIYVKPLLVLATKLILKFLLLSGIIYRRTFSPQYKLNETIIAIRRLCHYRF